LAATVHSAFRSSQLDYSNEVFVSGPVELRIGQPGSWTSPSVVAMRDAVVFPIGDLPVQWGHIGAQPGPVGSNTPNPQALVSMQVRAIGSGTAELALLHRSAPDSVLWVRYAPFSVIGSKTVAHATLRDDQLYPWGFPLFVDTQGDGIDDAIYYPEGLTPSDATPMARLQFQLLPSQPNPFNPTTTIRYVLPAPGAVAISVHDVRGRNVRTLFRGTQSAGLQHLAWNGEDGAERRLPSGIYVVHVTTPWGEATQKLVLLK
jgi:hypothetical protein